MSLYKGSQLVAGRTGQYPLSERQVSNCITEIPQGIKLELNNSVLTLKAGSKVILPNGFESDGVTPKFDEIEIESDIIDVNTYGGTNPNRAIFIDLTNNVIGAAPTTASGSSSTTSQYTLYYNVSTNKVGVTTNGTTIDYSAERTFPICLTTVALSGVTTNSIDQVFNGIGYIGSTVFALPGVKGLIPNGRNADGSLNNTDAVLTSVQQTTVNPGNGVFSIRIANNYIAVGSFPYDENTNYNYNQTVNPSNIRYQFNAGKVHFSAGKIISFTPKTAFHALDYNDREYIAHQAIPSNRHVVLTLGASGTSYTAPADGYVTLRKRSSATGNAIEIRNDATALTTRMFANAASQLMGVFMPITKGDKFTVGYDGTNTTNQEFRFIYANGAQ